MGKKRIWISWALAFSMLTPLASCGESGKTVESSESVRVNATDNQYVATVNSLTATDALGRSFNEALVSDSNNKVGLFYWIWHGEHTSAGIFNISELLENEPEILWGTGVACKEKSPINATHYWAEPLYGYYSSDDPWVIKKHLELFTMSGIDYLALDLTNLLTYDDTLEMLAAEIQRLQEQGWTPPTILPIFGMNVHSRKNIYPFYEKFYKNPLTGYEIADLTGIQMQAEDQDRKQANREQQCPCDLIIHRQIDTTANGDHHTGKKRRNQNT